MEVTEEMILEYINSNLNRSNFFNIEIDTRKTNLIYLKWKLDNSQFAAIDKNVVINIIKWLNNTKEEN